MRKEHQIIMLPSEKPSQLLNHWTGDKYELKRLEIPHERTDNWRPQHLYVLSDEEIKDGFWCLNLNTKEIYKKVCYGTEKGSIKKIIATTDKYLNLEDGQMTYIPILPQHIIEAYAKKPFDKVMVEYEEDADCGGSMCKNGCNSFDKHGEWCSGYHVTPKLNQDGTLAVSLVEEKIYSENQLKSICTTVLGKYLSKLYGTDLVHFETLDDLLKENL